MKIGHSWQEGEVVERRAAQVAYEDFLHRKQDPALLENRAGNSFSARVFPIAPRERKELIVAYSQELASSAEPYRLHLRGLPQLDELDASVLLHAPGPATKAGPRRLVEIKKQAWTPDQDLEVLDEHGLAVTALRHQNLAVARVMAPGATSPPAPITSLTVLFDTSASRALGFPAQVDNLRRTLAAINQDFDLRLLAFDQTTVEVFRGKHSALEQRHWDALLARGAMGASDLELALRSLAAHPTDRVLIVSDGITTAGKSEHAELTAAALALVPLGVDRIDALIDGGIQDPTALRVVTTAALPQHGLVLDARLPPTAMAHKLTSAALPIIKVSVPGAAWVWPDTLAGLQPGDEALVYADLPETTAMRVVLEGDDRIETVPPSATTERPLLERAWVGARINRLTHQRSALPPADRDARAALHKQVVDLSTRFRVLSDFTALLVLETPADYARFGISRNALTDILSVDAGGLKVLRRTNTPLPLVTTPDKNLADPAPTTPVDDPLPPTDPPVREPEVLGLGSVDLTRDPASDDTRMRKTEPDGRIGRGGDGGTGHGYGRGGSRTSRVPTVRFVEPEVSGGLEKEVVRRIVRARTSEIRACYSQSMHRDPRSEGRIDIKFEISTDGTVTRPIVKKSTLADNLIRECILAVIRRLAFPTPSTPVHAVFAFVLAPDVPFAPAPTPAELRSEAREQAREQAEMLRKRRQLAPLTGESKAIADLLKNRKTAAALTRAQAWRTRDPGDVLALLALGDVHEASKQPEQAARAYGSIIDLFPARADLRRYAGVRLQRLGQTGLPLAADSFARAVAQRPDHPQSHRLHAYALARLGRPAEAFAAILKGNQQRYPRGRFRGVDQILHEDATILGTHWIAQDPKAADQVRSALDALRILPADQPSLRFILHWETDANDVDFHILDAAGRRAWYGDQELKSGGELYEDVTTGYGPECFIILGKPKAFPYRLEAHYYERGPMGYGMGMLQVVQHDGKGGLKFEDRPFVIMQDDAFVQLGTVRGPL